MMIERQARQTLSPRQGPASRRALGRMWILAGALAALALPSARSDSPDRDLTDLDLEELLQIEIVSGASRYDQEISEAPAAVTIITADEIRAFGYRTFAEALQHVRGFYTTDDHNYSYLGVRGFSRAGDYNTRVLVLIDGHRFNDNIYEAANLGGAFLLDISLIERIEVIRGPSSSVYGAGAFFAVVNVITRPAVETTGREVTAGIASHGTYQVSAHVDEHTAGGVGVCLAAAAYDSQGPDLYFPEFDAPETNLGRAEGCSGERRYNFFSDLTWKGLTLRGGAVWREKGIPTAAWGTVFNDSRTRSVDAQGYVELQHEHEFASQLHGAAALSIDRYNYKGWWPFEESSTEGPYRLINNDTARGDWISAEYTATWQAHPRHKLIGGALYTNNFHQEQRNYDDEAVSLDLLHHSWIWALYVQDESALLPHLILNGGVRHDHYSLWGGVTKPRVALIYDPFPETTVKLIYGEAFRAPSEYELFYNDGGDTHVAADDLDPETIRTVEAVLEQRVGRHLRGSLSAYTYEVDGLIDLTTNADEMLVFANAGEVEAQGFEVEVEARSKQGWHGRASYAYSDTRNRTTDSELANSPPHLLKLGVAAPPIRGRLTLGLDLQYTSERRTKSGAEADGFWLGNLTLSATPLWGGASAALSLYNLFDEEYGHVASEEHLMEVIPQDGRHARLTVTQRF
jgi:outer membrane receptor for ferrienterochelin and colicins